MYHNMNLKRLIVHKGTNVEIQMSDTKQERTEIVINQYWFNNTNIN